MLAETKVDEQFIESMKVHRLYDNEKGFLEQCSESPIVFADKMLGVQLYAWQVYFLMLIKRAVDSKNNRLLTYLTREFLALTSRQIGKSTAIAIFCLWACVFNKYPGTLHNNTIAGIVSASDVQSKKLLYEMKKFLNSGNIVMASYLDDQGKSIFGKEFFKSLLNETEPNNTTTITFKAYDEKIHGKYVLKGSRYGSVIKSYPPTSSVLGETFTIVIEDEAGKSDSISDQFHYDYIYPTGNSTDALRIYTSTPWTPSGFFYRMADPYDEFEKTECERVLFTIDAIRIEAPDYYNKVKKDIDRWISDGKLNEVQRAYYCMFVKGEKNYFNPDMVNDCFKTDYLMYEEYPSLCDMGIDFGGQVTSRTVITISAMTDTGEIRRLYSKAYQVGEDGTLIDDVAGLLKRFNVQRIIPDDCPAGQFLIRVMKEKGWNIQPMVFRTDKVKKYGAFRSKLNRNKALSYVDADLKTEMMAMEQAETARQSLIMHAPGYTDDLIDSFVMSCYFYVDEEDDFNFYSANEDDDDEEVTRYAKNKSFTNTRKRN